MMRDGTYQLFALSWGHDGAEHSRLLSRFDINKGCIQHIEDHMGHADQLLPEGPIDYRTLGRLEQLKQSGYYKLVHEDDISACHHPELVQPMDFGEITPEKKFILTGVDYPAGQLVEVWGEAVTLAGRTLSEQELRELMDKVKDGSATLTPETV